MQRQIIIISALAVAAFAAQSVYTSATNIGKQADGAFLLPTNQLLKPWGEQMPIQGRPVDLTFDHKQKTLAVLNWRGVAILDGSTGAQLAEVKSKSTSYTGLAFTANDRQLWASEATRPGPDSIVVADLNELGLPVKESRVTLPGHPVPTGIAFAGETAWVAFSRNNTVGLINTATLKLEKEILVGMAPFSVVYSAKQNRVFVSNRAGRKPKDGDITGPTSGAQVITDPKTGATSTGTVSVIDVKSHEVKEVAVGLAPSQMSLNADETLLAVANAHSDTVSILNTADLSRVDVKIPPYPETTLGSQPVGVQWSPDGKLYVACGGNNAISIVKKSGTKWVLEGAVPTGWFPSAIAVDREGALRIANVKGVGSTINKNGLFNSRQYEGSIEKIPAPMAAQIAAGTREVRALNSPQFEPAGGIRNLPSLGIEHVLLIVKENRTYDQVLGDIGKGNSDPKLAMFGKQVTPNHHALAEQFALVDNFHTGGAISFDGHHWLMMAFVSDYVERAFAASPRGYAWNMNDALTIAPTGFFWQSGTRQINTRIYGEFCVAAKFDPAKDVAVDMNEQERSWPEYWAMYKAGKWRSEVGCKAGVPALKPIMSPSYPYSSTNIPDQMRADSFIDEMSKFEASGKLPNLMVMTLNEDHTNGTRPGSPTPRAMVADDDLALGRIVEAVSKSKFWSKTLILVTEDDAQDGIDHVDGHRTIALAIGPHVKRNSIVSDFYNHTSMIRTIQEIFRITPQTRSAAAARAMTSMFTKDVDLKPFKALAANIKLDEMNPPLSALKGRQLWAAQESAKMNWKDIDDIPSDKLNKILWWDAKGYNTPLPAKPGRKPTAARLDVD